MPTEQECGPTFETVHDACKVGFLVSILLSYIEVNLKYIQKKTKKHV